ncbi:MAG: patatin-like phospholipase family protein [Chitinophagales bacterium]
MATRSIEGEALNTAGKKIALVLGAGGARGLAHLGVIQVLLEESIPFDFIVGCSMGAIVGALYGAGADPYFLGKMLVNMNLSRFWDVRVPRMGFISGTRIEELIRLLTKERNFEQLDPPVAVVATDVETGEKVVIQEGSVSKAVRASMSIPGIFVPVKYKDRLLVDGAVAERLPIVTARELGADIVLAVDVVFAENLKTKVKNTLDVILQSIEILERQIFENITRNQADVLIQPKLGHIASNDFEKVEECVQAGRESTKASIDAIKQVVWENKI